MRAREARHEAGEKVLGQPVLEADHGLAVRRLHTLAADTHRGQQLVVAAGRRAGEDGRGGPEPVNDLDRHGDRVSPLQRAHADAICLPHRQGVEQWRIAVRQAVARQRCKGRGDVVPWPKPAVRLGEIPAPGRQHHELIARAPCLGLQQEDELGRQPAGGARCDRRQPKCHQPIDTGRDLIEQTMHSRSRVHSRSALVAAGIRRRPAHSRR